MTLLPQSEVLGGCHLTFLFLILSFTFFFNFFFCGWFALFWFWLVLVQCLPGWPQSHIQAILHKGLLETTHCLRWQWLLNSSSSVHQGPVEKHLQPHGKLAGVDIHLFPLSRLHWQSSNSMPDHWPQADYSKCIPVTQSLCPSILTKPQFCKE